MARSKVGFAKRELVFSKVDDEEGVAYGWLIVSTIAGAPYFDLQGDHIPLAAAKRAMADFMKHSRASDDQHDEQTIGDVVFCLPVEKGVTGGIVGLAGEPEQEGIVIGFKPHDRAVLGKISSGERRGFSIGGSLSEAHYVEAKRAPGLGAQVVKLRGPELVARDRAFAKDASVATAVKTRRVFDEFTINFASLVDWPAQEGATISVVKAATVARGSLMWLRKDAVLTSEADGHQHVIDPDDDLDDDGDCGWTGYATATGDDYPHSHEFVVDSKTGAVTIAANDGHSHTVDLVVGRVRTATEDNASSATVLTPIAARAPGASAGQIAAPGLASDPMTPEQIAELQALAEMNDAQKAHYRSLSKRDQTSFVNLSSADRDGQIAKALVADPVVYTCDDGTTIHKSQGQLLERLARKNDENANALRKQEARAEQLEFEKSAERVMKSYPGKLTVKAAIVKAISSIVLADGKPDEETRKAALEVVAAGEKALAKRFRRLGATVPDGQDDGDDLDPEAALNDLAKAHAKENKISFHKAYEAVMSTEEGSQLYSEMEMKAGRGGNLVRADVDDYDDDDSDGAGVVDEPAEVVENA